MGYYQSLVKARTHQPCAACKMLRRKCDSNCLLKPYFPSDDIYKFAGVHKVFGAGNVIKMIQEVDESKREDAVKAIVYEAKARLRDPVYGSSGAIFHLQKMVEQLQVQLESIRAQVVELKGNRDKLLDIIMKGVHQPCLVSTNEDEAMFDGSSFSLDDDSAGYDPLEFPLDCDWIL